MNNDETSRYEVTSLFSLPLYKANIGREFTKQEQDEFDIIYNNHLDNSNYLVKVEDNFKKTSIDKYLLKRKNLLDIQTFINKRLKQFSADILGIFDTKVSLEITQSWLNAYEQRDCFFDHYHSNSIISGVFYINCLKLPDDVPDGIIFNDINNRTRSVLQTFAINGKKPTPYNGSQYCCSVADGDLVLFPSTMGHSVEENKTSDQTRITLAFNTYLFGTFGDYNSTSELILKQEK